jgi:hypothetical protein
VNTCSAGVIAMARDVAVRNGEVANLSNTQGYISWRHILRSINKKCDIELKSEPYAEWKKNLRDGPLKPLEPFFSSNRFPMMGGWYKTDVLAELGEKYPSCKCPVISSDLVALVVSKHLQILASSSSSQ